MSEDKIKAVPTPQAEPELDATEDEATRLLRDACTGKDAVQRALDKQGGAARTMIDASLALVRKSRVIRQSSPGMKAVIPPPDTTRKLEALKPPAK